MPGTWSFLKRHMDVLFDEFSYPFIQIKKTEESFMPELGVYPQVSYINTAFY